MSQHYVRMDFSNRCKTWENVNIVDAGGGIAYHGSILGFTEPSLYGLITTKYLVQFPFEFVYFMFSLYCQTVTSFFTSCRSASADVNTRLTQLYAH